MSQESKQYRKFGENITFLTLTTLRFSFSIRGQSKAWHYFIMSTDHRIVWVCTLHVPSGSVDVTLKEDLSSHVFKDESYLSMNEII